MRCGLILVLLAVVAPWPVWGAPARPYNVREIPLAISLSAFRKLPHPDGAAQGTARIYCSDDRGAGGLEGLVLSPTFLQADTRKCGFYRATAGDDGEQLTPAPMQFLGEAITPLFLFYRPEGADDYYLAQITFAMSNHDVTQLIGLFYRAYGNPATLDVTSVSTSFGAEMPNVRYIWRNGLSSIQVDSLSFVLDQMSVVFSDNQLWGGLSVRLATIERMSRLANEEEQHRREAAQQSAPPSAADGAAPPAAQSKPSGEEAAPEAATGADAP